MAPRIASIVALLFSAGCFNPDPLDEAFDADAQTSPVESDGTTPIREVLRLPSGGILPVVDRRSWALDQTAVASVAQSIESIESARVAFYQARLAQAREAGVDVSAAPALHFLDVRTQSAALDFVPIPGGVGYGVYYADLALTFEEETGLVQRLVVPKTAGGDVSTWLYNTATNRAKRGVEAFISYFGQEAAHFKVFDWAKPGDEHWSLDLNYEALGAYLTNADGPDGTTRQEIEVHNYTTAVGASWVNQVYLRNWRTGTADLVYQYSYTVADPTQVIPTAGQHLGSWGPIFETFQDHDGSNKPIGITESVLVQDGMLRGLHQDNTSIRNRDPDLGSPIYFEADRTWAVGSTVGELSPTRVHALDAHLLVGALRLGCWQVDPNVEPGVVLRAQGFDQPTENRRYVFESLVEIEDNTGADAVIRVDLIDQSTGEPVSTQMITPQDFDRTGTPLPMRSMFEASGGEELEVVVSYGGSATVTLHSFSIAQI